MQINTFLYTWVWGLQLEMKTYQSLYPQQSLILPILQLFTINSFSMWSTDWESSTNLWQGLSDLILAGYCSDNHSWCEFTILIVMSYLLGRIWCILYYPLILTFHSFLFFFFLCFGLFFYEITWALWWWVY